MFAVSDEYSFVTIVSIVCSVFSLLWSTFFKRNLRDSMRDDDEAEVDHGDGAAAGVELAVVPDKGDSRLQI